MPIAKNSTTDITEDFDNWFYHTDPRTGVGIVINYFFYLDGQGGPSINLYTVSPEDVAKNDWHSDMKMVDWDELLTPHQEAT